MKMLLRCLTFIRRSGFLALALLPILGQNAFSQSFPISGWPTLNDALTSQTSGNLVITNFSSNSVISVQTVSETLQITGNVTIDGGDNNIVLDGANSNRLFYVHTNAQLVLKNLQLLHGRSTNGGAIFNGGTLIISNCTFAGNFATNLAGVNGLNATTNSATNGTSASAGRPAMGGAIYSLGPLSVYYSAFLTNQVVAGTGGTGGSGAEAINPGFVGGSGGDGGPGGDAFGGAVWSIGTNNVFFATEFIGNTCAAGAGGNGGAAGLQLALPNIDENGSTGQGAGGGAAAGGAAYFTGSLWMSNCVFYDNVVSAGASGAALVNNLGNGYNGIGGAPAGGGGLYLSNSVPSAFIVNSIFFQNQCNGGNGGGAAGNSTTAGTGGSALGGGIFSGATDLTLINCTLATNSLFGGLAGIDTGSTNGIAGSPGNTNGWQIYQFTGAAHMVNSILSGGPTANAFGVVDGGFNLLSDASITKSTANTHLNINAGLDSGLSDSDVTLGPTINGGAVPLQTLALSSGSVASNAIPGIPGLSFPATDERIEPRATPASIGAFEAHTLNGTALFAPASITAQPVDQEATLGHTAYFTVAATPNAQDPNPLGYQWQLNGSNLVDNGSFSGTATPTLTIKSVASVDLGRYQVFVSPTLLDSSTNSSNVFLLVDIPPSFKSQPVSRLNQPVGAVVNFSVNVGGAPPFFYQWESNGVPLSDGNALSGSSTSNLTINPVNFSDAASYSVVVSNFFQSVTSGVAKLSVVADKTKPAVAITSPAPGSRTDDSVITGTASDNAQVTTVFVWVTNIFNGTTNYVNTTAILSTNNPQTKTWTTVTNAFPPGSNTVAVQSVDYSGNLSQVAVCKFFYIVPSPFTLSYNQNDGTITGSASISGNTPPTNGAQLNLGEGYTLTAKPRANYLLTNWTFSSGIISNATTLHFVMTQNLSIQGNFVPSPFLPPVGGIYNGLFFPTNDAGPSEETAGMISHLSLGNLGAYSGTLMLDGSSYALNGSFNIFGQASNYIVRPTARGGPVSVVMNVGWTNSQITGYVSGSAGGWLSPLDLEEASGAELSSQSTLLLSPSTNMIGEVPPGDGYILLSNHLGNISLAGALADGSTFSQGVPLGKLGDVPVFANLYGNAGFLMGLINLSNGTPSAGTNFIWLKLAARSGLYTGGFTNSLLAKGSANSALTSFTGTLTISNASLNLSYQVSIANKTVTATSGSSNPLRGTFNPSTGALSLVFGNGEGKSTDTGYAALLEDANTGGGYFVTPTVAGIIYLTLATPAAASFDGGEEISTGASNEEVAVPPIIAIPLAPSSP